MQQRGTVGVPSSEEWGCSHQSVSSAPHNSLLSAVCTAQLVVLMMLWFARVMYTAGGRQTRFLSQQLVLPQMYPLNDVSTVVEYTSDVLRVHRTREMGVAVMSAVSRADSLKRTQIRHVTTSPFVAAAQLISFPPIMRRTNVTARLREIQLFVTNLSISAQLHY